MVLPKVNPLVMPKFPVRHVTMIPDDFAYMLRWHVLFLSIHKAKFPLLRVAFGLKLLPFPSYNSEVTQTKANHVTKLSEHTKQIQSARSSHVNAPFSCSFSSVM